MKTLLIVLLVLTIMICVILIPAFEEQEYAKTHPEFLKNAYDLRNATITQDTMFKE